MRVRDLKPGARFRINQKIFVLYTVNDCAALVEEERAVREVKIDDETEFEASGGRRYHIAPAAEVDEALGTAPLKERRVYKGKHVDPFEEAEKAIRREEKKKAEKGAV